MGKPNQPHALVVMTNGDVYYLNSLNEKELRQRVATGSRVYATLDAKSGKMVTIFIEHISSIVEVSQNA